MFTHTGEKRKNFITFFKNSQSSLKSNKSLFSYQFNYLAFKCTYCDRRYTQSADLNKHLRTHVGTNTYKCDTCDKSFRLLRELRKHTSEHYLQNLANNENDTTR